MKKILLFFIAAILFACNNNDKQQSSLQTTHLTQNTLYNIDSIKAVLTSSTTNDQSAAKKKFLEAIDLLKNKNKAAESIIAFKASLQIYPSEKTYFELGNALIENKNYQEAISALQVAEKMNYSPMANVMYKIATVYGLMPGNYKADTYTNANDSITLHYMQIALQMGYARPGDFLKDNAFDSIRSNNIWEFKDIYNKAMSGNKDPEKLAWDTYKNEFKDLPLPLNINTVWVYQQTYDNSIGYDYEKFVPEMRNGKFSREVENEYFYVGKIKEDSVYTALMYAGKNMWLTDGRGYMPVYFYLVTYTPQGKIIDKMQVGGQKSFTDNFKTLALKENLSFEIKDFKNVYEKDPEKDGYENNKVVKSDLITTNYFVINSKGKFEKADKQQLAGL